MSVLQTNTESEHRCGMEWSWPARLQFRVHLQKRGVSLRPLQVVAIPISGPPPASKLFRQIHFLAIIFTAHMQMLSPPQNYVLCNHDALRGFETGSIGAWLTLSRCVQQNTFQPKTRSLSTPESP